MVEGKEEKEGKRKNIESAAHVRPDGLCEPSSISSQLSLVGSTKKASQNTKSPRCQVPRPALPFLFRPLPAVSLPLSPLLAVLG